MVGTVAGVQYPAWLERDRERRAVLPGMALRNGDRLSTGGTGRLRLRMVDGGVIKLGPRADFRADRLERSKDGVFSGLLNVFKGAFRYTTSAVAKRSRRRNISMRVSGVTIGIRGTDIWGKAANDKDIVCLIEGQISVGRDGEDAFEMNEPLTFYIAPKGKAALPIAPVDPERLRKWSAQTDLQVGGEVATESGNWHVYVGGFATREQAQKLQARLLDEGYPANVETMRGSTGARHRIAFDGLIDERAANALTARLRDTFDVHRAWASQH